MENVYINSLLISLKETESLVFNKLLVVPNSRPLNIKSRKLDFSIKVELDKEKVFVFRDEIFILSSAVKSFEIPKDDFNLFKNHYHIPVGKILTVEVKVKDVVKTQNKGDVQKKFDFFTENGTSKFELDSYKFFRNALVSTLIASMNSEEKFSVYQESMKFIEEDSIVSDTLEQHLVLGDFVKIEIPANYSLGLERLVGALKSIKEAVLKTTLNFDKASLGVWIKKIVNARPTDNKTFFDSLVLCDFYYPKDWEGYKSFFTTLLFFAFAKDEIAHTNQGLPLEFAENLKLNESEVKFWNTFFKGLFSEKVTNIYLPESLRDLQFYCELLALRKTNVQFAYQNELPLLDNILNQKLPLNYKNPSIEEQQIIADEYSALVEEKPKLNTSIFTNINEVLIQIPTASKKTLKSNRLLLFAFTKDFKITSEVRKFLNLSSSNSKTKIFVIINQIDKTKEDIFSLEFEKLLNDFKDIISTITDIHTEVLMVRGKEENYNDLLRNLRKIYADNNLKSTKNLFLLDNFENQKIPQKIIEAIPNTIFWDSEKKYYYVMT